MPESIAVLDACVLYPAPIRDLLLNLADFDLFAPKWTDEIQKEWTRNLLANRPDLLSSQLNRTIEAMNKAFPESNVKNYRFEKTAHDRNAGFRSFFKDWA
ncbi:hypothetical protein [Persicitalea sp.]|uniref:hypothetical protein n=1 Tax=Persicitalea sp. TaxID=3100273 RepID=UPI0035932E18